MTLPTNVKSFVKFSVILRRERNPGAHISTHGYAMHKFRCKRYVLSAHRRIYLFKRFKGLTRNRGRMTKLYI